MGFGDEQVVVHGVQFGPDGVQAVDGAALQDVGDHAAHRVEHLVTRRLQQQPVEADVGVQVLGDAPQPALGQRDQGRAELEQLGGLGVGAVRGGEAGGPRLDRLADVGERLDLRESVLPGEAPGDDLGAEHVPDVTRLNRHARPAAGLDHP
jgi:hypothetical protein